MKTPYITLDTAQAFDYIKSIGKNWSDRDDITLEEWYEWINTQLKPFDAVLTDDYRICFFDEQKYTLWLLSYPKN